MMSSRPLTLSLTLSLSYACGAPSGSETTHSDQSELGETETETETGGDTSVPECEALIECTKTVSPEATSSTIAAYGPEGSCFDIPGVTPEDCAAECDALRAGLALINPDVAECAPLGCNDGVLGLDEVCDSTAGCSATCTFSSSALQCNPLNQTGCESDQLCWFDAPEGVVLCWDSANSSPTSAGDPCQALAGPCGDFSVCMDHAVCGGSPCCLATCYLGPTEADWGSCPGADECVSLAEASGWPFPQGTELYGVCI